MLLVFSYSVTDNIFQLIVDVWHVLLVNNDDDVSFSLAFCTILLYFACFLGFLVVHVWVCA